MRLFVLGLGVCALTSSVLAAGTGSFYTTADGRIIGPDGNEFVARGVNVTGPASGSPRDVTLDADVLTKGWNFNFLRVNTRILHGWTAADDTYLQKMVDTFTSRGVVLMFEAHDKWNGAEQWGDVAGSGGYYSTTSVNGAPSEYDQLNAFWGKLATKYKNNPYVWFNVQNEPVSPHEHGQMIPDPTPTNPWNQYPDARLQESDRTQWLGYHQGVINTIRAAGNNNMVVVDGLHWGVDTGGFWEDKLLPDGYSAILTYGKEMLQNNAQHGNVLFDLHVYAEWAGTSGKLDDFVQRARAQGLPLIFGEYATPYDKVQSEASNLFEVANKYGIGHAAWDWTGSLPFALTDPTTNEPYYYAEWGAWVNNWGGGWRIDSMTDPSNLSAFGQLVWADSHPWAPVPEPVAATSLLALAPLVVSRRRSRR